MIGLGRETSQMDTINQNHKMISAFVIQIQEQDSNCPPAGAHAELA
jgi:hypothetical protein